MRQNQIIWLISCSLLGLLFVFWGSLAPTLPMIPGDIWLIVPGALMIIIGLLGIFEGVIYKRNVRNYIQLKLKTTDEISLDEMSQETDIMVNELKEMIILLRINGKLQVYFSQETGKIMLADITSDNFCIHCGEPIDNDSYCSFCGKKAND